MFYGKRKSRHIIIHLCKIFVYDEKNMGYLGVYKIIRVVRIFQCMPVKSVYTEENSLSRQGKFHMKLVIVLVSNIYCSFNISFLHCIWVKTRPRHKEHYAILLRRGNEVVEACLAESHTGNWECQW